MAFPTRQVPSSVAKHGSGSGAQAAWIELDSDLVIRRTSAAWDALSEDYGLQRFGGASVAGQALRSLLDPPTWGRVEPWLRRCSAAPVGGPPPLGLAAPGLAPEDSPAAIATAGGAAPGARYQGQISTLFTPWPGTRGSIFLTVSGALEECLSRPLLRVDGNRVEAVGAVAERLLQELPELGERPALDRWMYLRQPALDLLATGLVWQGAPIRRLEMPAAFRDDGFYLLTRIVRVVLHDYANSLVAIRMMAEMLDHGGADTGRGSRYAVTGLTEQLDQVVLDLSRLRQIVARDSQPELVDGREILSLALELLSGELGRQEVALECGTLPEHRVQARKSELLLLFLALLFGTVGRCREGETVSLDATHDADQGSLRLEARLGLGLEAGVGPPPFAEAGFQRQLLGSLARSLGIRIRTWPGERRDRNPDWSLELAVEPQVGSSRVE